MSTVICAQGSGGDNPIVTLTPLVAAHGVYALCLIFIFFAWQKATDHLNKAPQGTRKHFERIHTGVVGFTVVLSLFATGAWMYSTFFYRPVHLSRGLVTGLTRFKDAPKQPEDGPAIYQKIALDPPSFTEPYSVIEPQDASTAYKYKWVVVSHDYVKRLSFRIQHYHDSMIRETAPLIPGTQPVTRINTIIDERRVFLDLALPWLRAEQTLELEYEPNATEPKAIGQLFARTAQGRRAMDWERREAAEQRATRQQSFRWIDLLVRPAFAQGKAPAKGPFDDDGGYRSSDGRALRRQLANEDIQVQLAARALLVRSGPRAFTFIIDSLNDRVAGNRSVLVHNLAQAVTEIERAKVTFPQSGNLALARALYEVGNYSLSAAYFDKAGKLPDGSDAYEYLKRGYAYQRAKQDQKAVGDFKTGIAKANDDQSKALAHNALGTYYFEVGRAAEARGEFAEAARLNKDLALSAQNNVAYAYADRGERLDEALLLIDGVLAAKPENAAYLDTKGWILFKQGKHHEAARLLERAVKLDPSDTTIADHLSEARARTKGTH